MVDIITDISHILIKIGFYNILRHSSSTYALIEGLNYLGETLNSTEKLLIISSTIIYMKVMAMHMCLMIQKRK